MRSAKFGQKVDCGAADRSPIAFVVHKPLETAMARACGSNGNFLCIQVRWTPYVHPRVQRMRYELGKSFKIKKIPYYHLIKSRCQPRGRI